MYGFEVNTGIIFAEDVQSMTTTLILNLDYLNGEIRISIIMRTYSHQFVVFSASILLAGSIMWAIIGCHNSTGSKESIKNHEQAILRFSLKLNPEVYKKSYYKKPPQFAIWLEEASQKTIRTVWVTQGTGTGNWGRNIVRPVSLPYWVSRWNLETQSCGDPTSENPAVDAVTGATPKMDHVIEIRVPVNSVWNYFVEINVSGDYNNVFSVDQTDGKRDLHGNGQPSIIYKGEITLLPGRKSVPELIGRTEQLHNVKHIINDMDGVTTAKKLLSSFEVSCLLP